MKEKKHKHDWPTGCVDFGLRDDMFIPADWEILDAAGGGLEQKSLEILRKKLSDLVDKKISDITGVTDQKTICELRGELNSAIKNYVAKRNLAIEHLGGGGVSETRKKLFRGDRDKPNQIPGILKIAKSLCANYDEKRAEEVMHELSSLSPRGWDWLFLADTDGMVPALRRGVRPTKEYFFSLVDLLERAERLSNDIANGRSPNFAKSDFAKAVVLALDTHGIKITTSHAVFDSSKRLQNDGVAMMVFKYALSVAGDHDSGKDSFKRYVSPAIKWLKCRNKKS